MMLLPIVVFSLFSLTHTQTHLHTPTYIYNSIFLSISYIATYIHISPEILFDNGSTDYCNFHPYSTTLMIHRFINVIFKSLFLFISYYDYLFLLLFLKRSYILFNIIITKLLFLS